MHYATSVYFLIYYYGTDGDSSEKLIEDCDGHQMSALHFFFCFEEVLRRDNCVATLILCT